jgi:hypothetical protein
MQKLIIKDEERIDELERYSTYCFLKLGLDTKLTLGNCHISSFKEPNKILFTRKIDRIESLTIWELRFKKNILSNLDYTNWLQAYWYLYENEGRNIFKHKTNDIDEDLPLTYVEFELNDND